MTTGALFNGTTSVIASTTGNDYTLTSWTFVAVFNIQAVGAANAMIFLTSNGGAPGFAMFYDGTLGCLNTYDGAGFAAFSGVVTATGNYMVVISKAAGSQTPRCNWRTDAGWQTAVNGASTQTDSSGTIDNLQIGLNVGGTDPFNGVIHHISLYNETTSDGTAVTYDDYSILSAKTNARFSTGTSLVNAGTMDDVSASNNNETTRTAIAIGNRGLPYWFTNFAGQEAWVGEVGTPVANTTGAASTTFTVSAGGAAVALAGRLLVATVAVDNSQTSPAGDPPGLTITDSRSNTWTVESAALQDPGAANAGTACYIAWTNVTTALQASDTISFTWGTGNPPAKAITVDAFTPLYLPIDSTTANGASTTPSASRTPTQSGQLVVGAISIEGGLADTHAADTDTTDGTWYHLSRTGAGTTTSGQTILSAYKVVSGTSAQTYNSTITSRDWAEKIVVFAKASPWKWMPKRPTSWVNRGRGRQARSR